MAVIIFLFLLMGVRMPTVHGVVAPTDTEHSLALLSRGRQVKVITLTQQQQQQPGSKVQVKVSEVPRTSGQKNPSYTMADYDPTRGFLYLASRDSLERVRLDGTDHEVLLGNETQHESIEYEGVAVDWLAQNVYYVDINRKQIGVVGLRYRQYWTVVSDGLQNPRAVTVDPGQGYLFWTDWGRSMIERSLLDGSERTVLASEGMGWPNGLALGREETTVYWVEAQTNRIEAMDYDGGNRRFVLADGVSHPFSVTLKGDYLYWTSWKTRKLERIHRHTGQGRETIHTTTTLPLGLVSLSSRIATNGTIANDCVVYKAGCPGLCFYRPAPRSSLCRTGEVITTTSITTTTTTTTTTTENPSTSAAAVHVHEASNNVLLLANERDLTQISLNTSQRAIRKDTYSLPRGSSPIFLDYDFGSRTIYYTSITKDDSSTNNKRYTISKMNMDGTGKRVVQSFDSVVEGVAIDWIARNIYWVSPQKHTISVSRLEAVEGSPDPPTIDIATGLGKPRCVCLDPVNGHVYWSDWGNTPAIERSFLDGSGRKVIVTQDLGFPNGMSLDLADRQRKLYWTDSKLDRIEVCDVDEDDDHDDDDGGGGGCIRSRRVLVSGGLHHPFDLDVLGDYVYWSDWGTRRVERVNKKSGGDRSILWDDGTQVIGVRGLDLNAPPSGANSCEFNNGGCKHICLFRPRPLSHVCASPNGVMIPGNANTTNANLTNANTSNANISNANISNANITNPNITDTNTTNANISNANTTNPNITNANTTNANTTNANTTNANTTNANTTNANTTKANTTNANTTNANTTNAITTNAKITNANITNANTTNANTTNANTTNANTTNADTTSTNTTNPNITNANTTNANITNANITNAIITNTIPTTANNNATNITNTNTTNNTTSESGETTASSIGTTTCDLDIDNGLDLTTKGQTSTSSASAAPETTESPIIPTTDETVVTTEKHRPSFVVQPNDITVGLRRTATFPCVVTGNPAPTVFWSIENDQNLMFPNQENGRFSVTADGTLRIVDVEYRDEHSYTCQALNNLGNAKATASLTVVDPSCACDQTRNQEDVINQFCLADTHIAIRATVRQVFDAGNRLYLRLRKRKIIYKLVNPNNISNSNNNNDDNNNSNNNDDDNINNNNNNDDGDDHKTSNDKDVEETIRSLRSRVQQSKFLIVLAENPALGGNRCNNYCHPTIRKGGTYLFLAGRIYQRGDNPTTNAHYVTSASGPEFRKVSRALRRPDTCAVHIANKLRAVWDRILREKKD